MQILLASAKIMADNSRRPAVSVPLFEAEARAFARDMLDYSDDELARMLGCSATIASQNKGRFMRFFEEGAPAPPAILAYDGQAYKHLNANTLSEADLRFANGHLWITSFLYGLLRPLDGIRPYRMEERVALPSAGGQTMFEFWRERLTDRLIQSVKDDDGVLVHLAAEEFQHLFHWARVCREVHVVQPLFYVRTAKGLRMQAVWAKTCRGALTRFIIEHRLARTDDLHNFAYERFTYCSQLGETDYSYERDRKRPKCPWSKNTLWVRERRTIL